ncbi:MAG: hypothetical protein ACFB15_05530 [Cyclobacteriaceae bacterium]
MDKQLLVGGELTLKNFLGLFNPNDKFILIELGDTWHPDNGFVNESILGGVKVVSQIIDYDYDFRGLVYLDATIAGVDVKFHDQVYTLSGGKTSLEKIISKIKALNHSSPKFSYSYKLL